LPSPRFGAGAEQMKALGACAGGRKCHGARSAQQPPVVAVPKQNGRPRAAAPTDWLNSVMERSLCGASRSDRPRREHFALAQRSKEIVAHFVLHLLPPNV